MSSPFNPGVTVEQVTEGLVKINETILAMIPARFSRDQDLVAQFEAERGKPGNLAEFSAWLQTRGKEEPEASPEEERELAVSQTLSRLGQDADQELQIQADKWGEQDHPPAEWLLILQEEYGELAKAVLHGDYQEAKLEAVQIIALLARLIEKLERMPFPLKLQSDGWEPVE